MIIIYGTNIGFQKFVIKLVVASHFNLKFWTAQQNLKKFLMMSSDSPVYSPDFEKIMRLCWFSLSRLHNWNLVSLMASSSKKWSCSRTSTR